MRSIYRCLVLFLSLTLSYQPTLVFSAMNSGNYKINWDTIGSGGLDTGSSTNYSIQDTIGGVFPGASTSTNYQAWAGYRIDFLKNALSLVVRGQGGSTGIAYTAFDALNNTVTVASASSFSLNQLISVAENVGFSQKTAVGFVTRIDGNTITVDHWSGSTSTMSAVPNGGDDLVYPIQSRSVAFGTLSASQPNVQTIVTTAKSSLESGFEVRVTAAGSLTNGLSIIPAVSDGSVTVGSSEYGMSIVGDYTSTSGDVAVTNAEIQGAASSTTNPARAAVILKAAIQTGSITDGSYTQGLIFTMSGSY